jgi:hypothetical protein
VPSANFPKFISTNSFHGLLIRRFVVLDGDLGSHATHGVYTSLVASLDQQLDLLFLKLATIS